MPPRILLTAISLFALTSRSSAQSIDELHQEIRRYVDSVRVEVFDDVAAHGCEDAVEVIDASLKLLETPVQRVRAIEACSAFAGAEGESEAIELLLEVALGRDTHIALIATRILADFHGSNMEALEKVVARGRSEYVKATAVGALLDYWKVNPQEKHIELFAERARVNFSGSERELRRWLWSVDHSAAQEVFPRLWTSRSVPDQNRALLVADIARRPEAIAQPMIWKLLTSTRNESLKAMAVTQVARRNLDVPSDWLRRTLTEADLPELRYQCARVLAKQERGEGQWTETLLSFARSDDSVEQYLAASFLQSTNEAERRAILEAVLQTTSDSAVQSRAAESVRELEDAGLTRLLIANLGNFHAKSRRDAQRSLVLLSERHDCVSDADWVEWFGEGRTQVKHATAAYEKWLTQSRYNLRETEPEGQFFGLDLTGQNVVFVLDASVAMSQRLLVTRFNEETKLSYQKLLADVLKPALLRLEGNGRVGLVMHTESVLTPEKKLVKWTEAAADLLYSEYMRQLPWGVGQSRLALQRAFDFENADTIVLVSGFGCRSQLLDEYDLIVDEVDRLNRFRHVTIHTVALGQKNELLVELARKNEGQYVLAQ